MDSKLKEKIWEAINEYAESCGGDTSNKTVSEKRMRAVVEVENRIRVFIDELDKLNKIADLVDKSFNINPPKDLSISSRLSVQVAGLLLTLADFKAKLLVLEKN